MLFDIMMVSNLRKRCRSVKTLSKTKIKTQVQLAQLQEEARQHVFKAPKFIAKLCFAISYC